MIIGGAAQTMRGQSDKAANDGAQKLLEAARRAAQAERVDESVRLYQRLLAQVQTANLAARRELARLLARQDSSRLEAENVYREAIKFAPRDAALAFERARNLDALGDTVNAILEYRRAFELQPDNEAALRAFLNLTMKIGAAPLAIERLRKQLLATPDELAAHLLLAELLRSEGRFNAAQAQFLRARRRAPDNLLALRGALQACSAASDLACAAPLLKQLAALTTRAQAQVEQARVWLLTGRPEAAMGSALRALNENGSRSADTAARRAALDVLADCHRARGAAPSERAVLEQLVQAPSANQTRAWARLARVQFEMGDHEAARATIARLLRLGPDNARGQMALTLLGPTPATKPAALPAKPLLPRPPEEAAAQPSNSATREVSAPAREQPRQNPVARQAARQLAEGEAALFWGQPARAIAPLRRALEVWPTSPRLQLALGMALLQTDQAEEASSHFKCVIAEEQTADGAKRAAARTDVLLLLAQAHTKGAQPELALAIYETILARDSQHLPALLGSVEALERMDKPGLAAARLLQIIHHAPEETTLRARWQTALAALGRAPATLPPPLKAGDALRIRLAKGAWPDEAAPAELQAVVAPQAAAETVAAKLDDDGWLQLPTLATPINANCRTTSELGALIAQQLAPASAAKVEVEVSEFAPAPVIVAGAVQHPGRFHIKQPLSLDESLLLAQGAQQQQAASLLFVLRRADDCLNLPSVLSQPPGGSAVDPLKVETYARPINTAERSTPVSSLSAGVKAGDLVYVPQRNTAFIVGAIAQPMALPLRPGATLRSATQQAGGVTVDARRDQVRLLRWVAGRNFWQEFVLNLDDIQAQRIGDVVLREGDIIAVPSRAAASPNADAMAGFAQLLLRLTRARGSLPQRATDKQNASK